MYSTCLARMLSVSKGVVNSSNYIRSIYFTSTTASSIQWPPSPPGTIQKVTIFFYNSPRPLHQWKQAKPTLCVCLLEKIASFIYRPLALFSQWIPGLNAISQETLPMCSPVIPHCLQAESSTEGGKKKLSIASQAIKTHNNGNAVKAMVNSCRGISNPNNLQPFSFFTNASIPITQETWCVYWIIQLELITSKVSVI